MKQTIIITVLIFSAGVAGFSQHHPASSVGHEVFSNAQRGYYVINSVRYDGVFILNENKTNRAKRVVIPQQLRHAEKTFYPNDIEEYGFLDEVKYVSAKINIDGVDKNVFLEEIINVDDSLFFYIYYAEEIGDVFFILDGSKELRMLNSNAPEEVWNMFLSMADCGNIRGLEAFPKKLTRKRINTFYNAYKDCNPNLFPRFQFGPVANIGFGKPVIKEFPQYSYPFALAFSAGAFFQLPFDEYMSLRTELLYSYLNNNGKPLPMSKTNEDARYTRHSITLPVLVRYTFNFNPWKNVPYFEMGLCFDYSYSGAKYRDGVLLKPDMILDEANVIPFLYGFSLGVGIEHKISHKRSWYVGIRYNWLTGSRQEYVEKLNFLGINVAISL